jgi:hypothetical protein
MKSARAPASHSPPGRAPAPTPGSVPWSGIELCPSRNLICSRSPPLLAVDLVPPPRRNCDVRQQSADRAAFRRGHEAVLRFRNVLCNLKSVITYHPKLPGKIFPVVNGQRHGSLLMLENSTRWRSIYLLTRPSTFEFARARLPARLSA